MQTLTSLNLRELPAEPCGTASTKTFERSCGGAGKRVLLLEDDAAFREILSDFLAENGYDVVAVHNGVEGVRRILANDFELILCDMLMPTLAGDMFYRAVERMRPHLCERFIFMTGYRGSARVNQFLATVNAPVLTKPFHVDDLLELFAFIQLRTTLLAA